MSSNCRYDIEGLQKELEVEIGDIAILYLNYLTEMHDEIEEAERYLALGDFNMLERVVHNIKGVSANLGVNDVYQSALRLDEHIKKGFNTEAPAGILELSKLVEGAEAEIRRFFTDKGYSF